MRIEKIEKLIKDGVDLDTIKDGLKVYFEKEDYNTWLSNKQFEYDNLFKTKEVIVSAVTDNDEVIEEQITYEYIDDCISFDEWIKNEIYITSDVSNLVNEYLKPHLQKDILNKIEDLEKQTFRPLRELNLNPNDEFAKTKLEKLDIQISELRKQL